MHQQGRKASHIILIFKLKSAHSPKMKVKIKDEQQLDPFVISISFFSPGSAMQMERVKPCVSAEVLQDDWWGEG